MRFSDLPSRLIFADVETTGLHSADRIVSVGLVDLDVSALGNDRLSTACTHLVFDPGKKSHPRAEEVHGYDDWTLRHQDAFAVHAKELRPLFDNPAIVWAHNAAFDQAFFEREFATVGKPISGDLNCTMQMYRERYPDRRASLKAIAESLGLRRTGVRHGALEDAWLAMAVYLSMAGISVGPVPPEMLVPPTNLRMPPPLEGPLPRRSRKAKMATAEAIAPPTAGYAEVLAASRPLATLVLFVAMADGEIAEAEWATLLKLVDETAVRLGHELSTAQRHDVVASLLDPEMAFSIRNAASAAIRDLYAQENLARWIREVTFADGSGSTPEHRAIEAIMDAIRWARTN